MTWVGYKGKSARKNQSLFCIKDKMIQTSNITSDRFLFVKKTPSAYFLYKCVGYGDGIGEK